MSKLDPRNQAIAVEALCNRLLRDPDPDVRCAAAEALAEIGAAEAIVTLSYGQSLIIPLSVFQLK